MGSNVNESDDDDELTPLMMASKLGFTDITKFLLSKEADTEARRKEGKAFDIALKYGNLDCATVLLKEKAQIDLTGAYELAIQSKHLCLLENLVENFTIDTKDLNLLILTIQCGSIEMFQYLINKGMDVNEHIARHYCSKHAHIPFLCPLHIAVIEERQDFVKVLLQAKADINREDYHGNTALFYACEKYQKKSLEMLTLLLESGANVNSTNTAGETPLFNVVKNKKKMNVTLLMESGSNVNIANNMGRTPLFYAIENADTMNVTLLLNSGASVNIRDNKGETPMLKAIQGHSLEMVSLLIDWKADTSAIKNDGGTYITELFKSIQYKPRSETIVGILQLLLKEVIDINKQEDNGNTALIIACKANYSMPDAVEFLLQHGADANLVNYKNETALSISLIGRERDLNMAKLLLKHKAKCYPLSICQEGVHLFIQKHNSELIPLALGNGVFPFVVKSGYSDKQIFGNSNMFMYSPPFSPLSLALYERRLDLAKYLIQVRFLTKYDVSDLLKTTIFRKTILKAEQGIIFNSLLSLYTLSFVQISEMLGATLDREEKVNQLPLPPKIKQQLLFRSLDIPFTRAVESVDTFSDSDSSV